MILLSMDSYAGDDSVLQKIAQYKQEATRYTDEKNYSKACDFWTTSLKLATAYLSENTSEIDYLTKRKASICNLAKKVAEEELKQTIEKYRPINDALTCGILIDVIRSCAAAGNPEHCTLVRFGSNYAEETKRCAGR
jgi:hypothetical protein